MSGRGTRTAQGASYWSGARGRGNPSYHGSGRSNGNGTNKDERARQTYSAITKRRAADVVQANPSWIVNTLDCAQQIAMHQEIILSDMPQEMKAAITTAITSTVHHCKTLPIAAAELKNPLGRREQTTTAHYSQQHGSCEQDTWRAHAPDRSFETARHIHAPAGSATKQLKSSKMDDETNDDNQPELRWETTTTDTTHHEKATTQDPFRPKSDLQTILKGVDLTDMKNEQIWTENTQQESSRQSEGKVPRKHTLQMLLSESPQRDVEEKINLNQAVIPKSRVDLRAQIKPLPAPFRYQIGERLDSQAEAHKSAQVKAVGNAFEEDHTEDPYIIEEGEHYEEKGSLLTHHYDAEMQGTHSEAIKTEDHGNITANHPAF